MCQCQGLDSTPLASGVNSVTDLTGVRHTARTMTPARGFCMVRRDAVAMEHECHCLR